MMPLRKKFRELVVVSGKGGTGKTSITASLAQILCGIEEVVVVDADVDAANIHLLLEPETVRRYEFRAGHRAEIQHAKCIGCGACLAHCRFDAVRKTDDDEDLPHLEIDTTACEGCGVCVRFCPVEAIDFPERNCGEWMVSEIASGPMVHAHLDTPAENSGKLVTVVREEGRKIATDRGISLVVVDGPPGVGCPVIASLTGADMALVVTEPSISGDHDLARILGLIAHFRIPAAVCVNKWDIAPDLTDSIERRARELGAEIAGRISYDPQLSRLLCEGQTIAESNRPGGREIEEIAQKLFHEEIAI